MSRRVEMPDLPKAPGGGTIRRWLKAPGDRVAAGQVFLEIETEAGLVDVEAAEGGVLVDVAHRAGETVPPGTLLARLLGETESGGDEFPKSAQSPPKQHPPEENAMTADASITPVLMPKAGNDMEEGTILKWIAEEGSRIERGDVLFELETDKATMEIESEHEGFLCRIVVGEEETAEVHAPVAYIADSSDADIDAFIRGQGGEAAVAVAAQPPAQPGEPAAPEPTAPVATGQPVAASLAAGERVKASPAARRIAAEKGLDLASATPGRGPGGRVITDDLEKARSTVAAPHAPAAASPTMVAAAPATQPLEGGERRKLSGMRRAIARNLTFSHQTIPTFYLKASVQADALLAAYRRQKAACGAKLNDFLVLAVGYTMASYPAFRSRLDGEDVIELPQSNIGIAVAVEDGLRVPAVVGVDRLSLRGLVPATAEAIEAGRVGKPYNAGQATMSISNLGSSGVEEFTAIINPPEVAILAVGGIFETVEVKDGAIRPIRQMNLWLSSDHRLIDGVLAAQFMGDLKALLESPERLET